MFYSQLNQIWSIRSTADSSRWRAPRHASPFQPPLRTQRASDLTLNSQLSTLRQQQALAYRDKLRLAYLLIQWARKEEEEQNPVLRSAAAKGAPSVSDSVQYVADRLKKTKPGTKKKLFNAIGAMFQFRGAISDCDKEKLVGQLQEMRFLTVTGDNRVLYLNSVPLRSDPRNTPRQAMRTTAAASPAS